MRFWKLAFVEKSSTNAYVRNWNTLNVCLFSALSYNSLCHIDITYIKSKDDSNLPPNGILAGVYPAVLQLCKLHAADVDAHLVM